jgi:hypothetical protein
MGEKKDLAYIETTRELPYVTMQVEATEPLHETTTQAERIELPREAMRNVRTELQREAMLIVRIELQREATPRDRSLEQILNVLQLELMGEVQLLEVVITEKVMPLTVELLLKDK